MGTECFEQQHQPQSKPRRDTKIFHALPTNRFLFQVSKKHNFIAMNITLQIQIILQRMDSVKYMSIWVCGRGRGLCDMCVV